MMMNNTLNHQNNNINHRNINGAAGAPLAHHMNRTASGRGPARSVTSAASAPVPSSSPRTRSMKSNNNVNHNTNNNNSFDEKARLQAEIARIEAELEQQRLQEEILKMEQEIAAATAAKQANHPNNKGQKPLAHIAASSLRRSRPAPPTAAAPSPRPSEEMNTPSRRALSLSPTRTQPSTPPRKPTGQPQSARSLQPPPFQATAQTAPQHQPQPSPGSDARHRSYSPGPRSSPANALPNPARSPNARKSGYPSTSMGSSSPPRSPARLSPTNNHRSRAAVPVTASSSSEMRITSDLHELQDPTVMMQPMPTRMTLQEKSSQVHYVATGETFGESDHSSDDDAEDEGGGEEAGAQGHIQPVTAQNPPTNLSGTGQALMNHQGNDYEESEEYTEVEVTETEDATEVVDEEEGDHAAMHLAMSSTVTKPVESVHQRLQRERLEAEIRAMEAAILAAKDHSGPSQQQLPSKNEDAGPARPWSGSVTQANQQKADQRAAVETGLGSKMALAPVGGKSTTSPNDSDRPPNHQKSPLAPTAAPPGRNGFLAAISQAATERSDRLEETGGELRMQEIEPEVEAAARGPPQISFSMAELITKKAKDREDRLAQGGEKKMTQIKPKEEYKKDFSNICLEAASMGRLTRLNEHVVEAVAQEKTPEQEWRSNGLLAIQWRSNHMSVIHEAAALGNMTKQREKVVSNVPEEEDEDLMNWESSGEQQGGTKSQRMKEFLALAEHVGSGQQKVDKLIQGLKEENVGGDSLLVRPMAYYHNIEEVKLPKKRPPKIEPKKAQAKLAVQEASAAPGRPLLDISKDAAERAWARRTRLDRPGSLPKLKEKCACPYCFDPSPYQTYAYKVKEQKRKEEGYESPDSQEEKRREQMRLREERRQARRSQHHAGRGGGGRPMDSQHHQQQDTSAGIPEHLLANSSHSVVSAMTTEEGPEHGAPRPRKPRPAGASATQGSSKPVTRRKSSDSGGAGDPSRSTSSSELDPHSASTVKKGQRRKSTSSSEDGPRGEPRPVPPPEATSPPPPPPPPPPPAEAAGCACIIL